MDRKIGKDQQRSTFGEWIFTRRHISWPQITLFLNFSSRATFYFRNGVIWEHFWWLPVHSFIAFSSLQILGSACSHRTCDHVVILFKRAEWNQWPMKRAKKIPPSKTSEVDTNYDCRQGNKWGHQLGCEFQSSRYVNLCLKGALINYLQPLWCGWYTPAYLSDLYSTGLWSQGSICEAYIYTWTWKRIYCNRQSLYSLLEQIDSFGNLKRKA